MKKSNLLKKAAIGAALVAIPAMASAQEVDSAKTEKLPEYSASNIEWHFTNGGPDKTRLNLFYNLPLNSRVYSFMEFYGKGGYFGKSMINIPIDVALLKKAGIEIKAEVKNALLINEGQPNVYFNTLGVGLEKRAVLPGNSFLSVKFLPLVLGKGGIQENNMSLGYFFSKKLYSGRKIDMDISSFLDVNIAAKGGPQCGYGESHVTGSFKTKHGKLYVGGGFNHNASGKLAPDNQAIIKWGYHVKK